MRAAAQAYETALLKTLNNRTINEALGSYAPGNKIIMLRKTIETLLRAPIINKNNISRKLESEHIVATSQEFREKRSWLLNPYMLKWLKNKIHTAENAPVYNEPLIARRQPQRYIISPLDRFTKIRRVILYTWAIPSNELIRQLQTDLQNNIPDQNVRTQTINTLIQKAKNIPLAWREEIIKQIATAANIDPQNQQEKRTILTPLKKTAIVNEINQEIRTLKGLERQQKELERLIEAEEEK
jgi:hypothetical protein